MLRGSMIPCWTMTVLVFLSNEQVEADECSVARKQYCSALPEHPCGGVIVVVTTNSDFGSDDHDSRYSSRQSPPSTAATTLPESSQHRIDAPSCSRLAHLTAIQGPSPWDIKEYAESIHVFSHNCIVTKHVLAASGPVSRAS